MYSFGLGNKQDTFFRSIFRTNVSGLGHGNNLPENNPVPMKINGLTNIRGIASGKKFCTAFNEQGQVFNWGVG